MPKNMKVLFGLAVVLIIVAAAWFSMDQGPATSYPNIKSSNQSANSNTDNPKVYDANTTSPSDSSNAAINTDLNSIDSQMTGLSNDSAKMDQSANP